MLQQADVGKLDEECKQSFAYSHDKFDIIRCFRILGLDLIKDATDYKKAFINPSRQQIVLRPTSSGPTQTCLIIILKNLFA